MKLSQRRVALKYPFKQRHPAERPEKDLDPYDIVWLRAHRVGAEDPRYRPGEPAHLVGGIYRLTKRSMVNLNTMLRE